MTTSNNAMRSARNFHLLAITTANLIVLADDFIGIMFDAMSLIISAIG
ncbi:hypothetical protein [Tritonibacter mobilis]|nr:hypothetical protein [Tritonibacter mobilis]